MDILLELERLADLRDHLAVLELKRQELKDVVLAPVAQQLRDIDAELEPTFDALAEELHDAEMKVKAFTIEAQSSIKGTRMMTVYVRGRTSWDGKKLDGYATAHPEITAFRTIGDPSVSIRSVSR